MLTFGMTRDSQRVIAFYGVIANAERAKRTKDQMRYQLVVQIKPASSEDLNRLVNWEEALIEHLATSAEVDGHDLGAGEFNIFIFTDDPSGTFRRIQDLPATRAMSASMVIAYRPVDGEDYVVLWPRDSTRFNIA
jgi:hypothetical protein